jgi:acetyl/propionyl-CoA carboxylase alpha subunit/acetyl-CoA carboxylase carboxyltransferase component
MSEWTGSGGIRRLLIANRGEIAIRIARAALELDIETVAIYSEDDESSLHVTQSDRAVALDGVGPKAYLDIEQVIAAAIEAGCDAVHPGYGFLSENATFARRCAEVGLVFVGPSPETLDLFGDKVRARSFAREQDVPVPAGTFGRSTVEEVRAFFASLPAGRGVMIKAMAGGGGRGMRLVHDADALDAAYQACASEAQASFGDDSLYVEELLKHCRHIEVQIVGDGSAEPVAFGERECSLQRRNQKVVEIAPAQGLPEKIREALLAAATRMAGAVGYKGLGTFEFLVPLKADEKQAFYFIEANPRVQVEHTVTDQVFGIDLVKIQIQIAAGQSIEGLGLRTSPTRPRGAALQCRVNLENFNAKGEVAASAGTIDIYEPPSGLGVRVDGFGYAGYSNNPRFDSLLAKLIVFSVADESFETIVKRAQRAVKDFVVSGVDTNLDFLANLLEQPELRAGNADTRFIDENSEALARPRASRTMRRKAGVPGSGGKTAALQEGQVAAPSPMSGIVFELQVSAGNQVVAGQPIATIEAMKMQFVVKSPTSGTVVLVTAQKDGFVAADAPICIIEPSHDGAVAAYEEAAIDLEVIRPDLAELMERKGFGLDENRPAAVARRHKLGKRTARENIDHLCDDGTFFEYGSLALAAQRSRHGLDYLIRNTPADGVICGIGQINGEQFGPEDSSCVLVVYDYTVLAGTQGYFNHKKQDRIFHLASRLKRPLVLYAEGGGGRPGDVDKDILQGGGVGVPTFAMLGRLSGLVPIVGVVSGRCFAGNAAMLGCCDVIIATKDSNLGMAGPAMIEGGGLGVYKPEEVGPSSVQDRNGVIDILTNDEAEATEVAKKYLGYFQGSVSDWSCQDQRKLRFAVPQNRKEAFSIRSLVETLCDDGSVLEMRPRFGRGLVTALVRIEGRPMGLIANDSTVLGGALDADASVKGARFAQLCDAFDLPLIALLDTPGFMVGPEAEAEALVRKACGLFVTGASLDIPVYTVIVRKAYGLGAQATAAGHLMGSSFCVAWPTGELGGMGFEGAVRLAYKKELAAIEDPAEQNREFERLVNEMYMRGRSLNSATVYEIDEVIDPADTRRWIMSLTHAYGSPARAAKEKKRPVMPAW